MKNEFVTAQWLQKGCGSDPNNGQPEKGDWIYEHSKDGHLIRKQFAGILNNKRVSIRVPMSKMEEVDFLAKHEILTQL